ncbi:YfhO family protein [Streptomyces sp. NBC_01497]|uniref:YfhO family protein n=1 Tax=Streptomyces sp. NBC_01497 TaxID=2903885 RepID=UPI002E373F64|nr:YfhO family protein [Streptomyces sp. NBC_01497]
MPTLESVRGLVRGRPAALAALITAVAVCAGDAAARQYPFGRHARGINDLGAQFVPFHAHLWDLLHGKAHGGLLLNWQSGFGAASLPDLGTYLTSPFALLVGVFPRDRIDLAVYVITVLKMVAAAAAMAAVLPRLTRDFTRTGDLVALRHRTKPEVATGMRPSAPTWAGPGTTAAGAPWWAAALLGATYALCGWSVIEASYNPMWLDGLIAFPLLCLVGEWARTARRPVVGPLIVALAWIANFYTAYMATIGAALVLILRLLLDQDTTGRERVRALVRAAWRVVLGVALSAPVLLPVYLGTKHAFPGSTAVFSPSPWTDVFARALPGTYSFLSPAVFIGAGALLLVGGLAFDRAVPARERAGWVGLVLAVAVSLQWRPTSLAWHAFAIPNGSPYRETFVLAGVVVVAAWAALSRGGPGIRPVLYGTAVLAALWLGAASSSLTNKPALALFVLAVAGTAGGLLLLARAGGGPWARAGLLDGHEHGTGVPGPSRGRSPGRWLPALGALLVLGSLLGQSTAAMAYGDHAKLMKFEAYPTWGADQSARAAAVAKADGWPVYRTDPGRTQISSDDPLLIGGEGAGYYSSMTSDTYTTTMRALGAGWTSGGRVVQSLDNPVTDAIFSVGARLRTDPGHAPVTVRESVPPLVTVRPGKLPAALATGTADDPATGGPRYGGSPFRNQEALLGTDVYTVPADHVCPVGREAYLSAPDYWGTARLGSGPAVELHGALPKFRAAVVSLGTVRAPGERITFRTKAGRPVGPKSWSVGCLDRGRLAAAVTGLKKTAAVSVQVGDSGVHARLPEGSSGYAVLSAPRIAGWSCDGRPADSYLGLVAVELHGGDSVDCSFRPPGLVAGGTAGSAAVLVLVAIASFSRRLRASKPSSTHHPRLVRRDEQLS